MNVSTILKDKRVQVAAIIGLALGGGVGVAYIWKKRKEKQGILIRIQELSFYDRNPKELEEMLADTDGDVVSLDGGLTYLDANTMEPVDRPGKPEEIVLKEEILPPERVNIFEIGGHPIPRDIWDDEAERNTRSADRPYIIHEEEFLQDEMGFKQTTVTYYEKDDILADAEDVPMYNYHECVGELRFGHGTNDPNTVYVRNERLREEWEILYNASSYMLEVKGEAFEEEDAKELKHSVQKFRRDL